MEATPAVIEQDMPRNDERGTGQDNRRVSILCAEFGFSPSKASRLVRAFSGECRATGADVTDEDEFCAFLIVRLDATAQAMRDRVEKVRVLLHSDPTGERATTRAFFADPDGSKARARYAKAVGS